MDILIVGCGIAGPVLASFLLLSGKNHRITVVERASSVRTAGQNVDIRGAGINVMRKLDLEAAVRFVTTGELGAMAVDSHNKVWGKFAADQTGQRQTGTAEIEILRGRLAELFYHKSKEISDEVKQRGGHGIEYKFGQTIKNIDADGTVDGTKYDLVVGADGLQSVVRKQVFGDYISSLDTYGAFYSMPSGPTDSKWRRWYHPGGKRSVMVRPSDDDSRTTVFMSFMTKEKLKPSKELFESVYKNAGWESERLIKEMNAATDFYCDIIAQVKMPRWRKGNVVLLGDAG